MHRFLAENSTNSNKYRLRELYYYCVSVLKLCNNKEGYISIELYRNKLEEVVSYRLKAYYTPKVPFRE